MNKHLLYIAVAALSTPAITHAAEPTVLTNLYDEAEKLKSDHAQWAQWASSVERVFERTTQRNAGHMKRSGPVRSDLKPLNLPLPFLMWRLGNEPVHYWAYIDAIAHHDDLRRIDALVEYRRTEGKKRPYLGWPRILTNAATPEWAFDQLRQMLVDGGPVSEEHLAVALLGRFADSLPMELRSPAYGYIRRRGSKGPGDGRSKEYFDILLRIDVERGRRDIIPYFGKEIYPGKGTGHDLAVVTLLRKYKGPSADVANAVREWLPTIEDYHYRMLVPHLRDLLLHSAPDNELAPALRRIDELIRQRADSGERPKWNDELDILVQAVLELDSDAAVEPLAKYANEATIVDLTRLKIVSWLVQRRYARLPEVVARWVREEDRFVKHWLRGTSERKWGEYGKRLLLEAERINSVSGTPPE